MMPTRTNSTCRPVGGTAGSIQPILGEIRSDFVQCSLASGRRAVPERGKRCGPDRRGRGPGCRAALTPVKASSARRRHHRADPRLGRSIRMAGFRPLHDRVLVKRIEAEERTPGGIIIPDTAKEKPVEGEVLAVGAGARDETGKVQPLDVKVGDRILFGKWAGTEVLIEGEDRLIMKESDILGVIEGDARSKSKKAA